MSFKQRKFMKLEEDKWCCAIVWRACLDAIQPDLLMSCRILPWMICWHRFQLVYRYGLFEAVEKVSAGVHEFFIMRSDGDLYLC